MHSLDFIFTKDYNILWQGSNFAMKTWNFNLYSKEKKKRMMTRLFDEGIELKGKSKFCEFVYTTHYECSAFLWNCPRRYVMKN